MATRRITRKTRPRVERSAGADASERTGESSTGAGDESSGGTSETSAGQRSAGVAMGLNTVTIDEQQLAAEAAAALATAPADPTVPAEAPASDAPAGELQPAESWAPFLRTAISPMLFGIVLPQWQVSQEEQDEWTEALGQCCDQLFPGGPTGPYACWFRLLFGSMAIVGVRAVQHGGKLPPLGPKRVLQQQPASDASASPAQ